MSAPTMDEIDIEGELLGMSVPGEEGPNPVTPSQIDEKPIPVITKLPETAAVAPRQKIWNGGVVRNDPDQGFDVRGAMLGLAGGPQAVLAYQRQKAEEQRYANEAPDRLIGRQLQRANLQDQMDERQLKRKQLADAIDPNSEASRAAGADLDEYLASSADMFEKYNPQIAATLRAQIGKSAGRHKMDTDRRKSAIAERLKTFQDLLAYDDKQRTAADDRAWKRKEADENQEIRREGIAAHRQSADAMAALAGARFADSKEERQRVRDEKEAEAYGKDMAPLEENEQTMQDVKAGKPNVNTGAIASRLQKARKLIGLTDNDWDTLEGRLAAVNNQIIKLQAGGNVTNGEAERMRQQMPSMDMDDSEFNAKLGTVMEQIARKKTQVKAKHPQTSSRVGVESAAAAQPAPHGNIVRQNGKTFQWNGSKYVEVK